MKNLDTVKKAKLIYSGELIFFSLVFLVLAILIVTGVLAKSETFMHIYHYVTLAGGTWMIADFIWIMCDKKRQRRASLIDKALVLPLGISLIAFDIIALANPDLTTNAIYHRYGLFSFFLYITIIYVFEGIYHWFRPIPGFLEEILREEEQRKLQTEELEQKEQQVIENKEPSEENKAE